MIGAYGTLKQCCCDLMSNSYPMQILFFTYMQNNVSSMLYKFWKTLNLCSNMLWLPSTLVHLSLNLKFSVAFLFWNSTQSYNMHVTRGKHESWARFQFVAINSYLFPWHSLLSHCCKQHSFCLSVYNLAYCCEPCMP